MWGDVGRCAEIAHLCANHRRESAELELVDGCLALALGRSDKVVRAFEVGRCQLSRPGRDPYDNGIRGGRGRWLEMERGEATA